MIAVDTNLLVYAHRAGLAEHQAARRALEGAANGDVGWGITLASVTEFWSVVTHRAFAGRPSTAREAAGLLDALRQAGAREIWTHDADFASIPGLRVRDPLA